MQVQVAVGVMILAAAVEGEPARSDGVRRTQPSLLRSVTGPTEPINRAVASGATAIITLQPVPPNTDPPTSYPPGSSIVGSTLVLGSVPARVWFDIHVTGWAPEILRTVQAAISASDPEMDGGGFSGSAARCAGQPIDGAGSIRPAWVACPSTDSAGHDVCTAALNSSPPCNPRPARCLSWSGNFPLDYMPVGLWCEPFFQARCRPDWVGQGTVNTPGYSNDSINVRFGTIADPGEPSLPDFDPSYVGTYVMDVPVDAKGTYTIDFIEDQTFLRSPPNNPIPIAALVPGIIRVISCTNHSQCNDGDACTEDLCQDGCCTNLPVTDWNQQTECCDPATGAQGLIPESTPCRTGGCSLGGSSGTPTMVNRPDGSACTPLDPCFGDGSCQAGLCVSQQYAGTDCPKVRFISFEAGGDASLKAYRVTLISLHHPNPPYAGGAVADFSAFEGEVRWVGAPSTFAESTANPTPVYAAVTGCSPHYQDWSGIDLLHVGGADIVPSSLYAVQSIDMGLDIGVESNYSEPIMIGTARWGDAVIPNSVPGGSSQPDFGDVSALIDKFRGLPTAVTKPRAVILGSGLSGIPDLTGDVNFAEIAATNDAFRGRPYPYNGPVPCP